MSMLGLGDIVRFELKIYSYFNATSSLYGKQKNRSAKRTCGYRMMPLFAFRTRARVPFGTSFVSHAHVHAYESVNAFMFIATRFCLPFLPNCCKCDIITVDDRLLRKRSKETAYLANKPQKPYQKISFSEIF